jgi:hypothetical protein
MVLHPASASKPTNAQIAAPPPTLATRIHVLIRSHLDAALIAQALAERQTVPPIGGRICDAASVGPRGGVGVTLAFRELRAACLRPRRVIRRHLARPIRASGTPRRGGRRAARPRLPHQSNTAARNDACGLRFPPSPTEDACPGGDTNARLTRRRSPDASAGGLKCESSTARDGQCRRSYGENLR